MYTRPVCDSPEHLIQNGKPLFGTYSGHPQKLDIRGVKYPYGSFPMPTFVTNLRIKSRLSYFFSAGEYVGCLDIVDAKVIGFAEVCFWNTTTKQRFVYRSLMGLRKRLVPHKLTTAATVCYRKSRYIRINWDREHDKLSLIVTLKGDRHRPSVTIAFLSHFSAAPKSELLCVTPSPTMRRCGASYQLALPLHGTITVQNEKEAPVIQDSDGFLFFEINRVYMRFRSQGEFLTAFGTSEEGHNMQVRIAATSQDAVDPDKYNTNVLFCDGKPTPLPPVVITHPYGILDQWIIQDTEGMIDLTFTPVSDNLNKISIIVLRTHYHTIYGTLEGVLKDSDGNKITLKATPGLIKKYLIRL